MKKKLILFVKTLLIKKVMIYAKKSGNSLTELIKKYLAHIIQNNNDSGLSSKLKKLIGSVKLPVDFNEEEILRFSLERKHMPK